MITGFSVIMPTYNQSAFIRRAILSLQKQTYKHWELIIVNDGCTDNTEDVLSDILPNPKITYIKNEKNRGLGVALNQGLDVAKYDYIAYLPSDDFYYDNHLALFCEKIERYPNIALVYSGITLAFNDSINATPETEAKRIRPNYCLQLVQTAHRKTDDRWLERNEWVTEDLSLMFWNKLLDKGVFVATNIISCFWANHPLQRHKIVAEKYRGGLNFYRRYYQIDNPIKLRVSKYKFIDEEKLYSNFRAVV